MRRLHFNVAPWLVVLTCAVATPIVHFHAAHAEPPQTRGYIWLDVNGEPLPFQDHPTMLHVMRTATPVSRELGWMGVPDTERVVLDHRNVRFHVVFRTIEDSTRVPPSGDGRTSGVRFRDAAIFESAAYELSELLDIGRVPPATERRIVDQYGTVQMSMDGILSEAALDQRGKMNPPDPVRWNQQMQIMMAFDNLIANTGRNPGNLLVDGDWNLWLIDHTHAFRQVSRLLFIKDQTMCERRMWTALQEVGEDVIREQLEPFLEDREVDDLLRRRLKLIRHFEKLIDKHGVDAVIFDLRPGAEG